MTLGLHKSSPHWYCMIKEKVEVKSSKYGISPKGYSFKQTSRNTINRCGGIAVILKKHIQLKKETQPIVTLMEIM